MQRMASNRAMVNRAGKSRAESCMPLLMVPASA